MRAFKSKDSPAVRARGRGPGRIVPGMIDPETVETAPLKKGLALWRSLAGARLYPSRERFSPRALGPLLRHTILIKVLQSGCRFESRVVGDAVQAVGPEPLQGLDICELDKFLPGYGAALRALYRQVCDTKRPMAFRGTFDRSGAYEERHREHLVLPLGASDAAVDHLLSLVVYTQPA